MSSHVKEEADLPAPGEKQELSGAPLNRFGTFQNAVYGSFQPSPFPLDPFKLEAAAKAKLPSGNFNYVAGCV